MNEQILFQMPQRFDMSQTVLLGDSEAVRWYWLYRKFKLYFSQLMVIEQATFKVTMQRCPCKGKSQALFVWLTWPQSSGLPPALPELRRINFPGWGATEKRQPDLRAWKTCSQEKAKDQRDVVLIQRGPGADEKDWPVLHGVQDRSRFPSQIHRVLGSSRCLPLCPLVAANKGGNCMRWPLRSKGEDSTEDADGRP